MFQLIYLYMTRPREDTTAFLSFKSRMQGFIENRFSSPDAAFYDTLQVTLGNYHFRERPWSLELLEEIDPSESYRIYTDRFADFGDFTMVFVGNFDPDTLRPLVKTYLGSLPSTGREEKWKDVGVNPPKGVIKKTVWRGMEPRSLVSLTFTGDFDWNRKNNYAISSMASVLRIKLRETLREDLSGTYGTNVSASTSLYPKEDYRINISFGCAPGRVEELTMTVFAVIDSLKTFPVDPDYITKVSETQRRSFETNLEQNGFWLSNLVTYAFRDQDPRIIMDYPALVDSLDPKTVRDAAVNYFNTDNYVQVILKPEE
jgi:zinc protease